MEISFPSIQSPGPVPHPPSLVVVNLPLGIPSAEECHRLGWTEGGACGSHQPLGKSSKHMACSQRTMLPGTSGSAGRGAGGTSLFLHTLRPAVPGAQGPWSWCPELLGDSAVDGPCPSLQPQIGPPSSRAGTPRGMDTFRGWRRRGGLTVPNVPSAGRLGDAVREEERWRCGWRSRDGDEGGGGGGRAGGDASSGLRGSCWGCWWKGQRLGG